ncbi:MAG: hypothetical protein RL563_683 [Pseudomonadota bacterium]
MATLHHICVYCGSSSGRGDGYLSQATALAQVMVKRNIGLVYGGASIGVMGRLADEVLKHNGRVIGIIPKMLATKEIAHPGLTELHITHSMHERKQLMAELADGFIALPGGIGTLEELFEIWTWAQLGLHQKPCGLLNSSGYYDALNTFLDHMHHEGFVKPHHRQLLMLESDPDALLDRFDHYRAPVIEHWITPDQA